MEGGIGRGGPAGRGSQNGSIRSGRLMLTCIGMIEQLFWVGGAGYEQSSSLLLECENWTRVWGGTIEWLLRESSGRLSRHRGARGYPMECCWGLVGAEPPGGLPWGGVV